MPDLTNEQYEAIGRLSISVNEIDYVVDELLRYFLSAKVPTVGELYLKRDRYSGQKRGTLSKVIAKVSQSFPQVRPSADAAMSTLKKIESVVNDRNNLIHGQLIVNHATKTAHLEADGTTVLSDVAHINSRAAEAKQLADELAGYCGEILFGADLL